MIDEKGKLFGKINIVDLIILIIVLAAVAYLGFTLLGPEGTVTGTDTVTLSFYLEECPAYVVDSLNVGDTVWDSSDNVVLGTVKDWEATDFYIFIADNNGHSVQVVDVNNNKLELNVTATGVLEEHGIRIGGTLYGVGHSLTIYAGHAKLFLKVSGIEAA